MIDHPIFGRAEEDEDRLRRAGFHQFPGSFLAGGAITSIFTNKPVNDFDYYFKSQDAFEAAVVGCYDNGYWCTSSTQRSVSFSAGGVPIQLMWFDWFETPDRIFDAFDFTCCMGAWDCDAKRFEFHSDFIAACSDRRLKFHPGTRFPLISALRVLKYQARGYMASREEILKIALACAGLNLNSWEDLRHQIGGIYGHKIKLVESGEFSVAKAIAAISAESFVEGSATAENKPGTPEELLDRLFKRPKGTTEKLLEEAITARAALAGTA